MPKFIFNAFLLIVLWFAMRKKKRERKAVLCLMVGMKAQVDSDFVIDHMEQPI